VKSLPHIVTLVTKKANHSLYPIQLYLFELPAILRENSSCNQLLGGSISLSPLYPYLTLDLHVT